MTFWILLSVNMEWIIFEFNVMSHIPEISGAFRSIWGLEKETPARKHEAIDSHSSYGDGSKPYPPGEHQNSW